MLDEPGEPEKKAKAGITVLGGIMVLSATFAQSLMIANFPWARMWRLSGVQQQYQRVKELTITQFLPISTWFPIVAASTIVPAPICTWSPTFIG